MELGWAPEFWHWWVLALGLLALETLATIFFFLWLAVAAAVVGGVVLLLPELSWQSQAVLFGVLSVGAAIMALRMMRSRKRLDHDHPRLNQRSAQYIGREFTLVTAIDNRMGTVKVDDTTWRVHGDTDLPAGTRVRVVGVDGVIFLVQAVGESEASS